MEGPQLSLIKTSRLGKFLRNYHQDVSSYFQREGPYLVTASHLGV